MQAKIAGGNKRPSNPPPRYNEDADAHYQHELRKWREQAPTPPNPYDTERR